MAECPFCGFEAATVREEVAHMNAAHRTIVMERLLDAGIHPSELTDEPSAEVAFYRQAIRRHRQQIKAREQGRRVSAVAADEALWRTLDP